MRVLLIGLEPALADAVAHALQHETRARLTAAADNEQALALPRIPPPDMVLVRHGPLTTDAVAFCGRMKAQPETEGSLLVLVVDAGASPLTQDMLLHGADHVLHVPLIPGELLATYRLAERLADMRAEVRTGRAELAKIRHTQESVSDSMQAFLSAVLERVVPGSRERGERAAAIAATIGSRFGIPKKRMGDLDAAARLHELGRITAAATNGADDWLAAGDTTWRYAQDSKVVMQQVHGLEEAGTVVASIYENWDGTGAPSHAQRGQIPLRSRILRAVIDYHALRESASHEDAILRMKERVGSTYDPLVIAHLEAVAGGEEDADPTRATRMRLPVTALREGMILAEDLYTDGGMKLLAKDTVLTTQTLEVIWRRHALEPIHQGASVHRSAA